MAKESEILGIILNPKVKKKIITLNFSSNTFIKYEIMAIAIKYFQLKKYLNKIKLHLKDIINDLKKPDL